MAHVFRFLAAPGQSLAAGSIVVLADDDARHAGSVLRLRAGAAVEVGDGAGRVHEAVVVDPRAGALRVGSELPAQPPLAPIRVLLAQSGSRADDAVEKLVELGVAEVAPLLAAGRRRDARTDRWERIARSAAQQAKLAWVPVIGPPVAFADALADGIACSHEEADGDLVAALAHRPAPVTLLIGPEAGFTADELAAARAAGAPIATLGPTVLRTETAAVVAAAIARDHLAR